MLFVFQAVMQDKWMNIGHDEDPLQPHLETQFNDKEESRLRKGLKSIACSYVVRQDISWCIVNTLLIGAIRNKRMNRLIRILLYVTTKLLEVILEILSQGPWLRWGTTERKSSIPSEPEPTMTPLLHICCLAQKDQT